MNQKHFKGALVGAAAGLLALGSAAASADTLFNETFDGVQTAGNYSGGFDSNVPWTGTPSSSSDNAGSNEDWNGVRFEGNLTTSSNVGVATRYGTAYSAGNLDAYIRLGQALIFNVSTKAYQDVQLMFDYLTWNLESADAPRVGYWVGNITGFDSERTKDLTSTAPQWSVWTDLTEPGGLAKSNLSWVNGTTLALDSAAWDKDSLWVAFYMDSSNLYTSTCCSSCSSKDCSVDYFKIDNVKLTGTVVPIPAAAWLFGSALVGAVGLGRRNRKKSEA